MCTKVQHGQSLLSFMLTNAVRTEQNVCYRALMCKQRRPSMARSKVPSVYYGPVGLLHCDVVL